MDSESEAGPVARTLILRKVLSLYLVYLEKTGDNVDGGCFSWI